MIYMFLLNKPLSEDINSTDLPCLTSVLAGDTLDSQNSSYMYCKFGNFLENFIFANGVKRHICDVKIRDKGRIYLYQSTTE